MGYLRGWLLLLLLIPAIGQIPPPLQVPAPATVLIVTDMEGVMGGADPNLFYGAPEHATYGCELLTAEVNAAIRGARAAGASRILLSDSHFRGDNLNWRQLPANVIRLPQHALEGSHPRAQVASLFSRYHPQAMILVGYHVMSGGSGFLPHTFVTRDHIRLDHHEVGEIALLSALAGHFGVPVVAVTGEAGAIREALGILPGVHTAATKRLLPDGWVALEPLPKAELEVEQAARDGFAARTSIAPLTPARLAPGPVEHWSCTLRRASAAVTLPPGVRRDGARLLWRSHSYLDGYWTLFQVFAALHGN